MSLTRSIAAGLAYFGIIFALGFVLGTLRVLVIIPRIGEVAAVSLEVPVVVAVSWVVARWCVARFAVGPGAAERGIMGAVAFAVLMLAELALATLLFGQSVAQHVAAYARLAGAIGLAGQIVFALIPSLQRPRGPEVI
jgi:hypothetical protein